MAQLVLPDHPEVLVRQVRREFQVLLDLRAARVIPAERVQQDLQAIQDRLAPRDLRVLLELPDRLGLSGLQVSPELLGLRDLLVLMERLEHRALKDPSVLQVNLVRLGSWERLARLDLPVPQVLQDLSGLLVLREPRELLESRVLVELRVLQVLQAFKDHRERREQRALLE